MSHDREKWNWNGHLRTVSHALSRLRCSSSGLGIVDLVSRFLGCFVRLVVSIAQHVYGCFEAKKVGAVALQKTLQFTAR